MSSRLSPVGGMTIAMLRNRFMFSFYVLNLTAAHACVCAVVTGMSRGKFPGQRRELLVQVRSQALLLRQPILSSDEPVRCRNSSDSHFTAEKSGVDDLPKVTRQEVTELGMTSSPFFYSEALNHSQHNCVHFWKIHLKSFLRSGGAVHRSP